MATWRKLDALAIPSAVRRPIFRISLKMTTKGYGRYPNTENIKKRKYKETTMTHCKKKTIIVTSWETLLSINDLTIKCLINVHHFSSWCLWIVEQIEKPHFHSCKKNYGSTGHEHSNVHICPVFLSSNYERRWGYDFNISLFTPTVSERFSLYLIKWKVKERGYGRARTDQEKLLSH